MANPNFFPYISKLVIGTACIPQTVADKLYDWHIKPMNKVRFFLQLPIWASSESGYRSYNWELAKGRSGNSQHCFGEQPDGSFDENAKGAVDWTCRDFEKNKDKLLELIIKKTEYTRIAVYDTFIHCDYKATDGKRYLFQSNSASRWEFKKFVG